MKINNDSLLTPFWRELKSKLKLLAFVAITGIIPAGVFAQDSITVDNPSFGWGYNSAGSYRYAGVAFGWTPSANNTVITVWLGLLGNGSFYLFVP